MLPIFSFAQSGKFHPVPPEADVMKATQALATTYQKEYEAAKSVPQKQALAGRLLGDAEKEPEPARRFALFQVARNMAVDVYDIDFAMRIIDELAAAFAIDEGAYRRDAIAVLAPNLKTIPEHITLARHAWRVLQRLVKRDRFPAAVELCEIGVACAKKSGDGDLLKQWTRRRDEVAAQAAEFANMKPVWERLQQQPLDPAANARAGKFYCFVKRDWERGLLMLALGDDEKLQALAEKDLRSEEPAADEALADAWYDFGQEQQPAKNAVLAYASLRYYRALPRLEGVALRRVENRLRELAPATTHFVKNEWTEILDLVQLPRDVVRDAWSREGLWVVATRKDKDFAAFTLPVAIAGSYDLRVRATVRSGPGFVEVGLGPDLNGALVGINAYDGALCAIARVDGKEMPESATKVPAIALEPNRSHVLLIAAEISQEIGSIVAAVDDKPIIRWRGPTSSLSISKDWPTDRLVISSYRTIVAIESVELRMRSGGAWRLE
jgi:hypothetical protein